MVERRASRRSIAVTGAAVLAFALGGTGSAGCGGDDQGDANAEPTPQAAKQALDEARQRLDELKQRVKESEGKAKKEAREAYKQARQLYESGK
jgi:hypothetical protein